MNLLYSSKQLLLKLSLLADQEIKQSFEKENKLTSKKIRAANFEIGRIREIIRTNKYVTTIYRPLYSTKIEKQSSHSLNQKHILLCIL